MIRRDVQDSADIWMKIHDGLKLETGNLCHGHRLFGCVQGHIGIRNANVSYHKHLVEKCLHDSTGQCSCSRLSVGSGNGDQPSLCHMVCQLDLTPDRDFGLIQYRYKRSIQRNARTDDGKLYA